MLHPNFAEFPFPRTRVNKGKKKGQSCYAPVLLSCLLLVLQRKRANQPLLALRFKLLDHRGDLPVSVHRHVGQQFLLEVVLRRL
jgi:hypothetical protein